MVKQRTLRKFAGLNNATARTARLLRTVANELERLGVRWSSDEDESVTYFDWANWMTVSPKDSEYEAVTLNAPRGITGCLLGRHVLRRADPRTGASQRLARRESLRRTHGLGDSEISHDRGIAREQHVGRLDVAMNDSVLVRIMKSARDVTQNADGFGNRRNAITVES